MQHTVNTFAAVDQKCRTEENVDFVNDVVIVKNIHRRLTERSVQSHASRTL